MIESSVAEDSCPTRASLVHRLKDWEDQTGWQEFFDTYWRLIYGTARRAGLGDAEAQDVVQETIITIAKAMPSFHYDPAKGSFKGWLRNTTHWRINDYLRRKARFPGAAEEGENGTETPVVDPATCEQDAVWDADWEKNLLDAAIEKVKRKVKPKQYQLFEVFVIRGWPMREITKKLQVSMGQVYFARIKVSTLLQKEVRELQRKWK